MKKIQMQFKAGMSLMVFLARGCQVKRYGAAAVNRRR